jgi:hypothetical protein
MLLHKVYYIKIYKKEGTAHEKLQRGSFHTYGRTGLADTNHAETVATAMGLGNEDYGYNF